MGWLKIRCGLATIASVVGFETETTSAPLHSVAPTLKTFRFICVLCSIPGENSRRTNVLCKSLSARFHADWFEFSSVHKRHASCHVRRGGGWNSLLIWTSQVNSIGFLPRWIRLKRIYDQLDRLIDLRAVMGRRGRGQGSHNVVNHCCVSVNDTYAGRSSS